MTETHDADPAAPLATEGAPRWVKVLGAIALLLVIGVIVVMLTGGAGGHGPARHGSLAPVGLQRPVS